MRQPEQTEVIGSVGQPGLAAQTLQLDIADDQIGLARRAVRNNGALHAGNDRLYVRFINTKDRRTVKWHAIHKLDEGALNIFEGGVLVEMFAVDGGDDGDDRRE